MIPVETTLMFIRGSLSPTNKWRSHLETRIKACQVVQIVKVISDLLCPDYSAKLNLKRLISVFSVYRNGLLRHSRRSLLAMVIMIFSFMPSKAAIEFDGINDYMRLGDNPILNFNVDLDPFSASAWGNFNSSATDDGYLVSKIGGGQSQYGLWISFNDGQARFIVGGTTIIAAGDLRDNWHFVCGINDGSTMRIFIDASLSNTGSVGSVQAPAIDTLIGARRDSNNFDSQREFNGRIDDVRIYNRVLSNTEILSLYNSRSKRLSGSVAQGLVAHYEMDDNEINSIVGTIIDASGNSNHGTGNGGASLIYTDGVLRR